MKLHNEKWMIIASLVIFKKTFVTRKHTIILWNRDIIYVYNVNRKLLQKEKRTNIPNYCQSNDVKVLKKKTFRVQIITTKNVSCIWIMDKGPKNYEELFDLYMKYWILPDIRGNS